MWVWSQAKLGAPGDKLGIMVFFRAPTGSGPQHPRDPGIPLQLPIQFTFQPLLVLKEIGLDASHPLY